jgi:hypothetical protein
MQLHPGKKGQRLVASIALQPHLGLFWSAGDFAGRRHPNLAIRDNRR